MQLLPVGLSSALLESYRIHLLYLPLTGLHGIEDAPCLLQVTNFLNIPRFLLIFIPLMPGCSHDDVCASEKAQLRRRGNHQVNRSRFGAGV